MENTSQGRDGEPEKAHRKSIPVQVWGKFQVLQNCCYCCFQRQPKLNFSSVTNCSGSVSVSGVGKVLPSGTHQSSKKPESYTSPGLSHTILPKMVPAGHGHPETQPAQSHSQESTAKSTEFLGDGNGSYCGFWLYRHFQ